MFDDTRDESIYENENNEELMGPEIIQSEVENALRAMKNGKAPGHDDVYAEVLKIMDPRMLTDLFNKIYKMEQIPKDWMKSIFVAIPKKNQAKNCGDYRLISLMSNALKVFLRVLHACSFSKCEERSGETQFGFKKGLGTR